MVLGIYSAFRSYPFLVDANQPAIPVPPNQVSPEAGSSPKSRLPPFKPSTAVQQRALFTDLLSFRFGLRISKDAGQVYEQNLLGPLAKLVADPSVTDLVCNGHMHTRILKQGQWQPAANPFRSEAELADAARNLILAGGRQLDQAHPFGNVTLDARYRLHALLGSAVNPQTHLSLRVHGEKALELSQLVPAEELQLFYQILQSRESFLISGSSGSGKTTLLRALLSLLPSERIIAIEDVAELNIESANYVALQARNSNVEGRGEIDLQELLTQSLRMRPDRIVVGEVRGVELVTLLQAINTGHACGATIHANSIAEVSKRMLAIAHTAGIGESALNALVRSSLGWLIHIDALNSRRKVTLRKLVA